MTGAFQPSPPDQLFGALQAMQEGIKQLVETDSAKRQEMEFLADLRGKMVEGLTILYEQQEGILRGLDLLRTPPASKGEPWWKPWVRYGYSAGVGIAVTGSLWLLWPTTPYKGFAIEVNGIIKQSYEQLPKGIQEQFKAVYRTYNFVEPGQRGGR